MQPANSDYQLQHCHHILTNKIFRASDSSSYFTGKIAEAHENLPFSSATSSAKGSLELSTICDSMGFASGLVDELNDYAFTL